MQPSKLFRLPSTRCTARHTAARPRLHCSSSLENGKFRKIVSTKSFSYCVVCRFPHVLVNLGAWKVFKRKKHMFLCTKVFPTHVDVQCLVQKLVPQNALLLRSKFLQGRARRRKPERKRDAAAAVSEAKTGKDHRAGFCSCSSEAAQTNRDHRAGFCSCREAQTNLDKRGKSCCGQTNTATKQRRFEA